jgi:uncharacterized protein (DUF3084 family)
MAGLRRLVEAMRQEARALEAELYAAREERTTAEMERATVADEADAANTALTTAGTRQAELMAQLEEVTAICQIAHHVPGSKALPRSIHVF